MAVTESLRRIFYQLALASLLASVVWASISVYSSLTSPAEIEVASEILEPLNPILDLSLMEEIASRERLSEQLELLDTPEKDEELSTSPTPSPQSTPPPATGSGGQTGSPTP